MLSLKAISKGCFEINPEFELLSLESVKHKFPQYQDEKNTHTVIRSKCSDVVKLVCSETARLFHLLSEQRSITAVSWGENELDTVLAQLVLDGILCILWNNQFVSGPNAWVALFEGEPEVIQNSAFLSINALLYAQALRLKEPIQLSRRLYSFHCVPITHFWRRLCPDSDAVIRFIGGNSSERYLVYHRGWLAWQARNWQWQREKPLYKLYLSPHITALKECWQSALSVFKKSNAVGLKIGADAHGLLRPDKIVAHFECRETLMETAYKLEKALVGFPSQGVPFTALLDSDGLLSWGVDLPSANHGSWRSWLTYRLATAMIAASEANLPVEPWQYAMERLRLEGVNTQNWTPTQSLLQ